MHIAEGVLIIIMAVLNLGGGLACTRRSGLIGSAGTGITAAFSLQDARIDRREWPLTRA